MQGGFTHIVTMVELADKRRAGRCRCQELKHTLLMFVPPRRRRPRKKGKPPHAKGVRKSWPWRVGSPTAPRTRESQPERIQGLRNHTDDLSPLRDCCHALTSHCTPWPAENGLATVSCRRARGAIAR